MAKKTEINREFATSIAHVIGTTLFSRLHGYSAKNDAQANLRGKTHYVDDGTLKVFYSRVMSSRETDHGLVFSIVESVAGDYRNTTRGFRFVSFDLFGTVINDRIPADVNRLHKSRAKAEKEMWQFLDAFDVAAHYKTELAQRAETMKQQSQVLAKLSKSIKVCSI